MGIASFLCILCVFWTICSFLVHRLLDVYQTEIVLYLRIKHRQAFDLAEWADIRRTMVLAGPLTLLAIFAAWSLGL